jgi:hypothetical protein
VTAVNKEALFAPRLPEQDVEIPGVGTIRVRALTREEALTVRGREMPVDEMERRLLEAALIAPALTKGEVRLWQQACPAGELEPVTNAILELSGMTAEAPKEEMKQFRD